MSNSRTPPEEKLDGVTRIHQKKELVKLKARNTIRAWKQGRRALYKIKTWLEQYGDFYITVEPTEEYSSTSGTTVVITHLGIEGSLDKETIIDFIEEFGEYGEIKVENRSKNMGYSHIVLELK